MQATAWSVIRSTFKDNFSFAEIKDIAGAAGLPIFKIAKVVQSYHGGATKGQLLDSIDGLYNELDLHDQSRVVINTIKGMVDRKEELTLELDQKLNEFGWYLYNGEPVRLEYQVDLETISLPKNVLESLEKSILRFRDGDISGSISSICASLDSLTEDIYIKNPSLGDHISASYHERVSKAFASKEAEYILQLKSIILDEPTIKRIWDNHK